MVDLDRFVKLFRQLLQPLQHPFLTTPIGVWDVLIWKMAFGLLASLSGTWHTHDPMFWNWSSTGDALVDQMNFTDVDVRLNAASDPWWPKWIYVSLYQSGQLIDDWIVDDGNEVLNANSIVREIAGQKAYCGSFQLNP